MVGNSYIQHNQTQEFRSPSDWSAMVVQRHS